jgi:phosphoribosylformylglycinamidine synthase
LYAAVESCSNFAIELGINIPTGKDSSMKQKYPNDEVIAPGQLLFRQVETVPILEKW